MKRSKEVIEKMREAARKRWANLTEEERAEQARRISEGLKERWAKRTLFERKRIGKLVSAARKAKKNVSKQG